MGARKQKSAQWLRRQQRDSFARQAKTHGFRARSAYKLAEIDEKYRLINAQSRVLDLGAAPGSWCQYVATRITRADQILGVDREPMQAVSNVTYLQGDFTDTVTQQKITRFFGEHAIDLVLSDMSPHITGVSVIDQANTEKLHNAVLDFCQRALKPGGHLLVKLFEGEAAVTMRKHARPYFAARHNIKPAASRMHSREVYFLACNFKAV